MKLKHLSLVNFKSYPETELSFCDGVNCIVGDNGVGKTNLLDAIYYLSFSKSFFNPIDSQNIYNEESFFVIQGTFEIDDKELAIHCGVKRGQRKVFKRNKKEYERLADHIGLLPLVMISPADSELVYEGSELRRKFMDGVISQYNKGYLDQLLAYNRALAQRNALLKQFKESRRIDRDALSVYDMQLDQFGAYIHQARTQFVDEFKSLFTAQHNFITSEKDDVSLKYDSKLNDVELSRLLEESSEKDLYLGYTSVGIHKDDLAFQLKERPLKKFGSQGQQKSFLVALKLAQFQLVKEKKGTVPLLLLDDIFDKLDRNRVKAMMKLVTDGKFGQVFITDANKERIESLFEEVQTELKLFRIEHETVQNLYED